MKHFTREQIEEIRVQLATKAVRDSDFDVADSLADEDLIPILQDGVNKTAPAQLVKDNVINEIRQGVDGKVLSSNDYTDTEKEKLAGIAAGAQVNAPYTVVDPLYVHTDNNYTTPEKTKLRDIAPNAQVNVIEAVKVNGTELPAIDKKVNVDLSNYVKKDIVPTEATPENPLADKDFVNSSISTATADFRGTSAQNLSEAQFLAWAYALPEYNKNDYVYWDTVDTAGTPQFRKYKYTGTEWAYEYTLNNSSFTASEWASIRSGITSDLTQKIAAMPTVSEMEAVIQQAADAATYANTKGAYADEKGTAANTAASLANAATNRANAAAANCEADHTTAQADHVQAGLDHTRAESDHSTAASDHQQAGSDHTTAASDHTTAGTDHTRAEQDHTRAESDHGTAASDRTRAESDHAIAAEDHATLDEKIAHKADIDGYYGGMTVGTAENLVGRGTTEAEYVNRRTSAGTADIGSGSAAITRIKGRSVVWNQILPIVASYSNVGLTVTMDANGHIVGSGVSTSDSIARFMNWYIDIVIGHKYYFKFTGEIVGMFLAPNCGSYGAQFITNPSQILTATGNKMIIGKSAPVGKEVSIDGYLFAIDLTLLGVDNLTTVEEVEAWLAQNIGPLDYYAYNPGEVINNAAEGVKTRGFNLFNYATGKAYLPGKYSDYPYEYEICGTFTSISFTDVNGNTSVPELHEGRFFNVDAPGELTVVGGNNTDTLVHLVWSGWRNEGEPDYVYEPYWENTLNLGLTSLTGKLNGQGSSVTVFPHGLAKVGDVQDEIVGNRAIKRVGVVDMGSLTWTKSQDNMFGAVVSAMPAPDSTAQSRNSGFLCPKYTPDTVAAYTYAASGDKTIKRAPYGAQSAAVWVKDSGYVDSTTATFKTAVTGQLLYYELATPEEYILDNPPQFNYRVDDFSTEETVPSYDPANVIAPLAYDVQYAMNAVDAIRRLPDNYVERTDVKQTTGNSEKFVLSQKAVNDNYAKKVGVEDNLTVGLAKNIEGNATSGGFPFTFVKISGTDGLAKINDVRGNSLVWNQLVREFSISEQTSAGATFSVVQGVLEIVAAGGTTNITLASNYLSEDLLGFRQISGHKYYSPKTLPQGFYFSVNVFAGGVTPCSGTITEGKYNTSMQQWSLKAPEGTVTPSKVYCPIIFFDLTLMFGAGNEPATVEEFEALFPLPYYAYNAGEIISNKTEQVKAVGFNQWDEVAEVGYIDATTGENDNSVSNCLRSKNAIPVFPLTTYYFRSPVFSDGNNIAMRYYDAAGNYIGSYDADNTIVGIGNKTFKTPAGCHLVRFVLPVAYGTTYNHDICINLSDPAKNGTYEPYKTNTIELNLPTLTGKVNGEGESVTICADGLKSAGSVYDEGIVENGYLTKIVKRIGVVDLGTLNYTYGSSYLWMVSDVIADMKLGNNNVAYTNALIAAGYTVKTFQAMTNDTTLDKCFSINAAGKIIIRDTAYTSADTFKAAMDGVKFIYESNTPITYVLDTSIPATFQSYKGGTLKQIPENGSVPTTAPHAMSVTYAIDIASIAVGLPQNYISRESLQAMLTAMQSAGLFSAYTMTFNSSTGKYEFTFQNQ